MLVITPYDVDAADMCAALSSVTGVEHVSLEFDGRGDAVLRVRLATGATQDDVVGAAVAGLRRQYGPGVDASRLRLTGPSGRPVVAVVDGPTDVPHNGTDAGPAVTSVPAPGGCAVPVSSVLPVVRLFGGARDCSPRVVVERVEVVTERWQLRATVDLSLGERTLRGTATAVDTAPASRRAVVIATARAVGSVIGASTRLDVEAVDLLQVGEDRVGVVVLTLLTERGIDRLVGSALVREDGSNTLVRATLDALNRRAGTSGLGG